jgi:hypothetical protein
VTFKASANAFVGCIAIWGAMTPCFISSDA